MFILKPFIVVLLLCLLLAAALSHASIQTAQAQQTPTPLLWQDVNRASLPFPDSDQFQLARTYRTLKMNRPALFNTLNRAPLEASKTISNTLLSLPLPDGSLVNFRLEESPVLPDSLAAKYPALKSFRGEATDNSGALMRCDWSPRGLHATILYQNQWVSIHPLAYDNADYYVSYYGSQVSESAENLRCQVDEHLHSLGQRQSPSATAENVPVGPIRTPIA